jgi:hypothetical protein
MAKELGYLEEFSVETNLSNKVNDGGKVSG